MNNSLYARRTNMNLTQKQIAEYAGITIRYYQYVEAGKKKPTIQIALKIAEILNSTVEELYS